MEDRERYVQVAYFRSFSARSAVEHCLGGLNGAPPGLFIVFCGGKHDPNEILSVLRSAHPGVPVVGGSAVGAISLGGYGYSGLELAIVSVP